MDTTDLESKLDEAMDAKIDAKLQRHEGFGALETARLLTFQDLVRKVRDLGGAQRLTDRLLHKSIYSDYDVMTATKLYVLDQKDDFPSELDLSEEQKATLLAGKSVFSDAAPIYYSPLIGDLELSEEIGRPKNKNVVVGVLAVTDESASFEKYSRFVDRMAGRVGMAVHHFLEDNHYKSQAHLIEDVVGLMSHDLKGPIMCINAYCSIATTKLNLLANKFPDNSEIKRELMGINALIDPIGENGSRMNHMIDFMSSASVNEKPNPDTYRGFVIKNACFNQANSLIRNSSTEDVYSVFVAVDSSFRDKKMANMYREFFDSIFQNIVGNALTHATEQGVILVNVYKTETDFVLECTNTVDSVLQDDKLKSIGDFRSRFGNSSRRGIGRSEGIGLYVLNKNIARLYGGNLTYTSGTDFLVQQYLHSRPSKIEVFGRSDDIFADPAMPKYCQATVTIPLDGLVITDK